MMHDADGHVRSGLHAGPYPQVDTQGELPAAESEWLHTNGAGAYAMSTVALMHTRRGHGILVAALQPPLGRYVVLSHADAAVEVGGKKYRLWTHQFPDIAPTPGYRLLRRFVQAPLPTWQYRLGEDRFEMKLSLVRGQNALVLGYTWHGATPARLVLRPLLPFRPAGELMREHGAMVQRVHLRSGEVEIQPVPHLPSLVLRHDDGVFVGSPDWWRRFEYNEDRNSGADYLEDMWTPGTLELDLQPNRTAYLVAAVGQPPPQPPHVLQAEAAEFGRQQDPGTKHAATVRALCVSAAAYCQDACRHPVVMAGYPPLGVVTRDALVALPGLYLARERFEQAKAVLRTLLDQQQDGLVPSGLSATGEPVLPQLPDATLLLLNAGHELVQAVGEDDPFVRDELYVGLRAAFSCLRTGRAAGFWLSDDGLVANGADGVALTWMDGYVGDHVVTPRRGLAVELQALWSRGTACLARLARNGGDPETAEAAESACGRARSAFRERFWCNETDYPFDCVSVAHGTVESWVDAAVRPNAVIALAVDPELFDDWQAAAIVGRARAELLTPRGLRSLAPHEPGYRGDYEGPPEERGSSYHQGTAWPFLLGYFVRAALRLAPDDPELRAELRDYVEQSLEAGLVLGHISQLTEGEEPYRPRGCPAQAWSVAELTRALVSDLGL